MPIVMTGHAIKLGRAMRNMSQRQLAQATGLRIHRVWQLENDVTPPRPEELALILGALASDDSRPAPRAAGKAR